uniref:hypothetical protein n=1 Tax=Snodgrassella sp. CFCC 13594 TaxID=1775559 RepID=UPI000AF05401
IGSSTALGTGTVTMADDTEIGFVADNLDLANDLVLSGTDDPILNTHGNTATWSGNISGTGILTVNGSGTLITKGSNSYSGTTNVIDNTTLQAGKADTFSANSEHNIESGSTLALDGYSQTIAALSNSGTVDLHKLNSDDAGAILTVSGNY